MDLSTAEQILEQIEASNIEILVRDLVRSAVRYSRLRVDWLLAEPGERRAMDPSRTAAHDAFIDSCNILARNMGERGEDSSWRTTLGHDRRVIGDFACCLQCLLGIRAR